METCSTAPKRKSCSSPASGLPGGGQLEVRMEISPDHPDPDIRGVARRVKFFNLESWHKEWTEVAIKNEELASASSRTTANRPPMSSYLRAADFYRRAVVYMAEGDPRMLPTYKKLEENFNKAWSTATPPFERVEISYEGHKLPAHFWPGRGKPGSKLPVVYNYGGADGILLRGEDGGAGQYVRRGISLHRRRWSRTWRHAALSQTLRAAGLRSVSPKR